MKKYWYIALISILVIFSLVIFQFFSLEGNEMTNKQEIDKAKVVITSFLFDLKEINNINNINNNSLKLFKSDTSLK